ncbi:J domain-containing protein [Fodinicurvata sp. EGI_FJ10296]|uniref:J domain-containing protein n=1 Tax=Fodinicurvata sp. EGI_FJ10296 TaxID=3231908 RepID=UPI003455971C
MKDELYNVLGLTRSATDDDIRKAYRKLAKRYHPDVNPNDAKAEEMFKKVGAAYAILSDAEKREQYDAGMIGADGEPVMRQGWPGAGAGAGAGGPGGGTRWEWRSTGQGHADADDIFSDLFRSMGGDGRQTGQGFGGSGFGGQTRRARGRDVAYTLTVPFVQAAVGGKRPIKLIDGRTITVTIPEGVDDGQTLRLRGQGEQGRAGGPAGDALVEIHVQPDSRFERHGKDIHADLKVGLREAVLGGRVTAQTVHGPVSVSVKPNTSSGTRMRLKGKGIDGGDHYARVMIALPAEKDPELTAFVKNWQQATSDQA